MSVENVIREEASLEFEEIGKMELGSDAHAKAVQAANAMVDRLNESDKIENEKRRLDIEERRLDIEERKVENDRKLGLIRNALTFATFVGSVGVTIWANIDSKRFEQGFTHTTDAGRSSSRSLLNLLDKLKF